MSGNNIERGIVQVENTPQSEIDFAGAILSEEVFDYRAEYGLGGGDLREGLEEAGEIVWAHFEMGLRFEPKFPATKIKILKIYRNGRKLHADFVRESRVFMRDNDWKSSMQLGVDRNTWEGAQEELNRAPVEVAFENVFRYRNEMEQRKKVMREMTVGFVQNYLGEDYSREEVEVKLHFIDTQAKVFRGMAIHMLTSLADRDANPLFLMPEDMEIFADVIDEHGVDEEMIFDLGMRVGELYGVEENLLGLVGQMFVDFIHEAVMKTKNWHSTTEYQKYDESHPKYWDKFMHMYDNFPVGAVIPDVHFAVTPQNLVEALDNNGLHLWMNGVNVVYVDDMGTGVEKRIPGLADFVRARQTFNVNKYGSVTGYGSKILQGEAAWKRYLLAIQRNPRDIAKMKERIETLTERMGENAVIEDDEVIHHLAKIRATSSNLSVAGNQMRFMQRTLKKYDLLQEDLGDSGEVSEEKKNEIFEGYLKSTRFDLGIDVKYLDISLENRKKKIDLIGWDNFSVEYADGFWGGHGSDTIEQIDASIDRINNMLLVLKESRSAHDEVPPHFYTQKDRLDGFLRYWRGSKMSRKVSGKNDVDGLARLNDKLNLFRSVAQMQGASLKFLVNWYHRDLHDKRGLLKAQRKVMVQKDELLQTIEDIDVLIDTNDREGEAWNRLTQKYSVKQWRDAWKQMNMKLLPEELTMENWEYYWGLMEEVDELCGLQKEAGAMPYDISSKEELGDIVRKLSTIKRAERDPDFVRFLHKLEEIKNNPLLPWNFEGEVKIYTFMSALKFRMRVIQAWTSVEVMEEIFERESDEFRGLKSREKSTDMQKDIDKLRERIELREDGILEEEEKLYEAMDRLGFAVDAGWFRN